MKHVTRIAFMAGVAVGALWLATGDRGYTHAASPETGSPS